jgi:hypothetical protein
VRKRGLKRPRPARSVAAVVTIAKVNYYSLVSSPAKPPSRRYLAQRQVVAWELERPKSFRQASMIALAPKPPPRGSQLERSAP